jgi:CDP-diacylglycerol--serine O-phosphatidyltransferase
VIFYRGMLLYSRCLKMHFFQRDATTSLYDPPETLMSIEQKSSPRKRGIYLLPNLFTLTALFAGFYAIIAAMKGHFDDAAIAVFIAMVMDTLDGRVARLTNTQTEFGAQLDSLSDMVSFGVAPAIILYTWGLNSLGKVGWLIAFVYAACVALRLARFNVQHAVMDKRYFRGLPCPPAAAVLVSLIWSIDQYALNSTGIYVCAAVFMFCVSLFMVSNLRYASFKEVDLKNKVPFICILLILLFLVVISVDPPLILWVVSVAYAFSPLPMYLWRLRSRFPLLKKHRAE